MKKVFSIVLAVVMMLTVAAGCTQTGDTTGNDKETASESKTQDNKNEAEDALEPITFTMYNAETNPYPDNFESPVAQKIKEATGVTLDVEFAVGGSNEKLSIMAASGDYPDLLFAKGDLNLFKNVNAVVQLDDLIEEYGPNIQKLFGDYLKRLRWSLEDPHIYSLGTGFVYNQVLEVTNGFNIQHAVVKELGYPELRTLNDMENAIREYKEKYSTIDGQETIGLSLLADDWRFLISVTNPAVFATGGPDNGEWFIDPDTLEAQIHHTRPEEKEYFRWLNHMNNTGLLDPESFVQKYDVYKAKLASGRVLAIADAKWEYNEAQQVLRQDAKHERMYGQYPLTLSEDMKYAEMAPAGYSPSWGVSITTACEEPERAIQFLDWLCTEEAQILNHWGIEGEHYEYDENGKRYMIPEVAEQQLSDPEFTKKTGIGQYAYPFPQYGNGYMDSTGNPLSPTTAEKLINDQTDVEKEVLAAYDAQLWKDLYPQPEEFPVRPYGYGFQINPGADDPELSAIATRLQEIGQKRIPQVILADPAEFDGIWDEYQQELKDAGLEKLEAAYNEKLQERLELWGVTQ